RNRKTARCMALNIQIYAMDSLDTHLKTMPLLAQRFNGALKFGHGMRAQPAAKCEEMRAILRRATVQRQLPDKLCTFAMGVPDDNALILEIKQRFIALRGNAKF